MIESREEFFHDIFVCVLDFFVCVLVGRGHLDLVECFVYLFLNG